MDALNILENEPMSGHTSFRVGGSARFFIETAHEEDIFRAREFAVAKGLPLFVMGLGSNVVVSDKGYEGVILHVAQGFSDFAIKDDSVTAKAGTPLARVARACVNAGLGGMHLLAGIPGSVGGAVRMNAGAYGEEISQTLLCVRSVSADGNINTRMNAECDFGYRHSVFAANGEVVVSAQFLLASGAVEVLKKEMDAKMKERREKQPLEYPSAGSMFKRPADRFPGALIESAGLKGYRIGGAQVSEKHANFIINAGGATAQNVNDLSKFVQDKVLEKSGTRLEREVIFLGDFG